MELTFSLQSNRYILEYVATRAIPAGVPKNIPAVVMKMDIEGSEIEVMSDLLVSGAMNHIDLIIPEWHPQLASTKERLDQSNILAQALPTLGALTKRFSLISVVDQTESYHTSNFELPKCH